MRRIRRLFPRSKRLRLVLAALVLLLAGAALGGYLYARNRTGSIYHPNARFVPQPTPKLPTRGLDRFAWRLSSRAESSPLLDHGKLFFGSEGGTVYAMGANDGHVIWTYHADGAVKASPSLSGGLLYFGDYSGHVQAVSERTGRLQWKSGSGG